VHDSLAALYDVAGVRLLEHRACAASGIASLELMERAGTAAYRALRAHWPRATRIAVVCGAGNNGGDGYVLARLAHADGLGVTVIQVGTPAVQGDAALAWQRLQAQQIPVTQDLALLSNAELVVDAVFGIGLNRAPAGPPRAALEAINAATCPRFSLDVPSGLNADTGQVFGVAVHAALTLTFIANKCGLVTGAARDFVGAIEVATLEIPSAVLASVPPRARWGGWNEWRPRLAPRARTAHKGDHGHVLIVGGAPGMGGAVRLAAEAALRSGAGLVSVAVSPEVAHALNIGRPEIMSHAVHTPVDLAPLVARATVIALGPGLGQSSWAVSMWAALRDCAQPLILDADALNLLARDPALRADWILTPHPGEAARLLGDRDTAAIARDRLAAVAALQSRYGGTVVLKGAGTLVQAAALNVIAGGNPGMATGGMGDVLTGVIAALVAQGLAGADAAAAGAALHAAAGDAAAAAGERGLLASDLLPWLRTLVN
jgi:ADP-dependent NAD(P)H-hydrate dehydratase / NAD(P)H-hydrate epimerase